MYLKFVTQETLAELAMNAGDPATFQRLDSNFETLLPFKYWRKCSNEKVKYIFKKTKNYTLFIEGLQGGYERNSTILLWGR